MNSSDFINELAKVQPEEAYDAEVDLSVFVDEESEVLISAWGVFRPISL